MLHFIYGRTGTGKSSLIYSLAQKSAQNKRTLILVPDREAVTAERDCADFSGAGNIDVVTFSRLCNFIFRKKGGLCENYIGAGAKKIIMYNVLRSLSPTLLRYGNVSGTDSVTVEKMLAARSELYRNMISPDELYRAAEKLSDKPRTFEKLSDISVIFSAFDAEVARKWSEPDGALSRATALCGDYFCGTDVYIDSFYTFTKEQYKMLSEIFSSADEVYITLAYLPESDRDGAAFVSLSETDTRLHSEAKKAGIAVALPQILSRAERYNNDEIAFLAENMFSGKNISARYTEAPHHIRVVSCANPYSEAEAVATDIARRVRGGMRYRDAAVIMRETGDYEGIIDAALEKYGIPYFLSRRADIDERPLVRFIYSVYSVVGRGFRCRDVIGYIKTDFAAISSDEADMLENYMIKWNISGKKFYSDEPWVSNPRGYESRGREDDEETLKTLNEIRGRIKAPLLRFAGALKDCVTVRDHAVLLYDLMTLMKVPEKISSDAKRSREAGDIAGAGELCQLWRVFCGCLDQIVGSAGDTVCGAEEFLQLLKLAFSETGIGVIPTSVDEVLVGGAAKIRPLSAKAVYIIGACDGVFPRKAGEDGIFSEYEKELLENEGVEFSSRLEKSMSDEMFYFYSSACSPSDELFITYSDYDVSGGLRGRSLALKRIFALFPKLEESDFEATATEDLIYCREPSFEYSLTSDSALSRALRDYFAEKPEYSERIKYASQPLSSQDCRLDRECADELFSGGLNTSYTRLENYIRCRFQYFCKYELDLADNSRAGFSEVNIGSFLHAVLEAAAKYAANSETDEAKLDSVIRSAANSYISAVTRRPVSEFPPRLRHMTDHLCVSAKKFAGRIKNEFSESKFRPMDFELKIGAGEGSVEPLKIGDGEICVRLSGSIDRVDAYEDGDGKLYLRVVDYKKTAKRFDLEKISMGLDLQMLLYLFSLWENGEKKYGKEIVPAGVIYVETNPAVKKITAGDEISDAGAVSGMILAEGDDGLDVAKAMEPSMEGKYIPVKVTSRGNPKNLMGLDALRELKTEVVQTVLGCAKDMKSGSAFARPIEANGLDPCKYCKMKAVCRISEKGRMKN